MQQSTTRRGWRWVSAPIILAVGLALYAPSLGLMLFSDDAPHMQWLSNQQAGSYWRNSEGFPVYRPATFAAWDVLVSLLGGPNALAFHALSLLLHLTNGLLAGQIATLLAHQRRVGLMTSLLFIAFPFSYGAVILAAAQFHLWQLFGLLAGAWLMLGWFDAGKGWWRLALGWLLVAWAIFQHENGVLAPVLVGGILVSRAGCIKDWKRLAVALGPAAGLAVIYLILRSLAIKAGAGGLQLAAVEVKVGQTLQVFGFPLAALLRLLFSPENGLGAAWLSGSVVLAVMLLWTVRQRHLIPHSTSVAAQSDAQLSDTSHTLPFTDHASRVTHHSSNTQSESAESRLTVLGIGWFFLAMILAWLFVPVDYLLGSVRLHYLASAGMAWAYASMLAYPLPRVATRWPRWVIGGFGLSMCLVIAAPFIWARLAEFRKMDAIYRDIGEVARQTALSRPQPPTPSLMVLNGPSVMSPPRPTFLLGSEGSVYLPDYVSLESLLWVNGFISEQHPLEVEMRHATDVSPAIAVDAPELNRSALPTFDVVMAVQDLGSGLHALVVGEKILADLPSSAPLADSASGVVLEAGRLDISASPPTAMIDQRPDVITLTLDWRVSAPPQQPIEIFVHLLCDGEPISQADGPPLGRVYPFALWQPGERWRDIRYFALPMDQADACLQALVGLYDPVTGSRITLTNSSGHSIDGVLIDDVIE